MQLQRPLQCVCPGRVCGMLLNTTSTDFQFYLSSIQIRVLGQGKDKEYAHFLKSVETYKKI